jgi:hypothetical protein
VSLPGFEEHVQMRRRRPGRDFDPYRIIHRRQARQILLGREQVRDASGQVFGIVEFLAKLHRRAGIDDEGRAEIGLLLIELNVIPIAAGVYAPIEMAKFVAGGVFAMLGELDRKTTVGAFMLPGDDALDHLARGNLQLADAGGVGGGEVSVLVDGHNRRISHGIVAAIHYISIGLRLSRNRQKVWARCVIQGFDSNRANWRNGGN